MKSVIKKIFWITISLPPIALIGLILLVLTSPFISEALARALAPSEYPNSTLVDDWVSGGPDMMWDRKTYTTRNNPEDVVSFMESHLGELEMTLDQTTGKTTYRQGKCNETLLARLASLGLEPRPCASVTIFVDPEQPDITTIWIWISWPAP